MKKTVGKEEVVRKVSGVGTQEKWEWEVYEGSTKEGESTETYGRHSLIEGVKIKVEQVEELWNLVTFVLGWTL